MTSDNSRRLSGVMPRVGGALGKFAKAAKPVDLPAPRLLELPGRGRTCVIDAPGPEGAPVVILLHALATTAALSWYPSVAALTQHYRVIAFDQRWHGRGIQSDHFRIADCADDVVAVADALGVDKFMLVG
jgi:3-oxoadipate enol-lactonase